MSCPPKKSNCWASWAAWTPMIICHHLHILPCSLGRWATGGDHHATFPKDFPKRCKGLGSSKDTSKNALSSGRRTACFWKTGLKKRKKRQRQRFQVLAESSAAKSWTRTQISRASNELTLGTDIGCQVSSGLTAKMIQDES